MAGSIFILEDHPARLAEMRLVMDDELPGLGRLFFDDERRAIAWLTNYQAEAALVSLDHDLDSVARPGESAGVDHGTGRGVADFLASQAPTCPVIVHTSNVVAGDGMYFALTRANWPTRRVHPCDHHGWIARDWRATIQKFKADGWL